MKPVTCPDVSCGTVLRDWLPEAEPQSIEGEDGSGCEIPERGIPFEIRAGQNLAGGRCGDVPRPLGADVGCDAGAGFAPLVLLSGLPIFVSGGRKRG